ncbi:hypothetical protein BA1379B_004650 [Bartonella sp. A1379B]|uniref:hypothetical protein n=1 Tax=Bartonella sp. A1379B TaxID=1933910 RepID=UPI0009993A34|nr:hypothetical protein [Bartonella sp. A1379B]AQX18299.1 hypothetical protein BA1379B_004650 [Bartonella sp. A1379B]
MVQRKYYTKTLTLIDYLSYSAVRLLNIYAMLLKIKKANINGAPDLLHKIDSTKQQLDEISYALVLEYRKRQENEHFLKQILMSISDQIFSLNNGFKETSRLLFQEIRTIQSQIQYFYEGAEKQNSLTDNQEISYSSSKIDDIIQRLQKARQNLAFENPHLFEK